MRKVQRHAAAHRARARQKSTRVHVLRALDLTEREYTIDYLFFLNHAISNFTVV